MASISFLYPNYLWLLLLVPFFIFVYFFSLAYNKKKAFVFSNFQALERFYGVEFFSKNYISLFLNILVLILIVFSVAGTFISFEASTTAHTYVLLIDNSGSMSSADIEPNRFSAAKEGAMNFIAELPVGVGVGIVGFSGDATVYQTITNEKIKSRMGIQNVEFGDVEGTNVYNAIITADRLFDNYPDERVRSVILISDGQINVGEAPQIISYADRNEIIINTIAIGTAEGGVNKYNVVSKTDSDFLKALSFNTGGTFFSVEDRTSFANSFDMLIELVDDEVKFDISFYLLLAALILFTLHWIFFNLRLKVFP